MVASTALTSRPRLRDMTILDQYGQPIPVARKMAALNPRGMQTYSSHAEMGLTVEALASYHREAENGQPTRLFDVWDGLIQRHGEVRGMLNERNEDVAGCEWCVVPPAGHDDKQSVKAAAELDERLRYGVEAELANPSLAPSTCFRTFLSHTGTAVPYGIACTNLVWDYVDGVIVPIRFEPIAARRFAAPSRERAHEVWLIDGLDQFKLIALEPGLWATARYEYRNPWVAGLMTSADWWILFALTGFKQYQIFADMFGLPLAIGYYEEGASPASREALEDAVRAIGQDGYAVLSALTELVIKETARGGDSSTVYPQIWKICDTVLTKLITGGTLNTDVSSTGAGSYNAATVHESREFKMKRRDAERVQDVFSESIGRPFIAWNGYDRAAVPRLKISLTRDELQRAQTLEILGQAIELSGQQIYEEFNLRRPSSTADAVKFMPTAPPDPGKAREERKR